MTFAVSDEACPHAWDERAIAVPGPYETVHRDECAYCCYSCFHSDGIYVCMRCYAGFCSAHLSKHMELRPSHTLYTRIHELQPEKEEEEVRDVSRLGVVAPKKYDTAVCCAPCRRQFFHVPELSVESYHGIIHAAVPGAVEASANEPNFIQRYQCPHLVCLEQMASPYASAPPTSNDKCIKEDCDCRLNNWMCVTCGAIGCPRAEAGGRGHALLHFHETGHPACVKLGTVTSEGADYYCYECDDAVSDVHLASHMAHFGIDVNTAKKTAKTLGEMEYEYSSLKDFGAITEAGADLTPSYGPGHTGIRNTGNSCYIASVVQCLMSLGAFQEAFYAGGRCAHQMGCVEEPLDCRTCQLERVADGLLSGRFSEPGKSTENGIAPRYFKNAFARLHPEFSTGAQQDAQEYLLYLLEEMRRFVKKPPNAAHHVSDQFTFLVQHRTRCRVCCCVRYRQEKEHCLSLPIPVVGGEENPNGAPGVLEQQPASVESEAHRPQFSLEDCINQAVAADEVQCRCEGCGALTVYENTIRFATYPNLLVVCLRRAYFDPQTLTTKKRDVYVEVPERITLEAYRGHGPLPDEMPMPAPASSHPTVDAGNAPVEVDETALVTLISMGISMKVAEYGLQKTQMNVERALDYIFSHPDIEIEMAAAAGTGKAAPVDATNGSQPAAPTNGPGEYHLVAMISHMGAGAKTGHYVCHVKDARSGKWLLFNDEKVGESQNPPFKLASIYFFARAQ